VCSWIATKECAKISNVSASERHQKYDNQSQHSCSEQECYGRSGFCDCNGNYEFDDGEPDFSCEDTSRETRCNETLYSSPVYNNREANRNVLCNQMCKNYNCTYTLYQNADCQSNNAFDNFILYGATKYGDFPPQYLPSQLTGKCMYEDNPKVCPGMPGAWRSVPQACDNDPNGPWHFQSVKINQEGCSVSIFEDLNQHGTVVTVEYDAQKAQEGQTGPQCINLKFPEGMTNTRSAYSREMCSKRRCTKRVPMDGPGAWNPEQNRLAGRGVLWNDCVTYKDAFGQYCQNYPDMQADEICQLWDGAFRITDQADISANIVKNSTVISENLAPFPCAIIDICNLPPTATPAPTPAHAVR